MHYYQLFGRVLASALEFPELPATTTAPADWCLTVAAGPPPAEPLSRIGSERVTDDADVVLHAGPSGYRLDYDDTGTFHLCDGGRSIVWHPPAGEAVPEDVRSDVLGRVIAVALHAAGVPTLHGSGVALDRAGVAFLAPKGHGKSTTAAALVRAGGRLLGDDILAIVPGSPPLVLPAVPAVHLWRDSAERLAVEYAPGNGGRKGRIDFDGPGDRATDAVPLAALYLLQPVAAADGRGVQREQLSPRLAALALLGQSKIGELLGGARTGELLDRLAAVSASVPVFRLTVPRELDRIAELIDCMAAWHGAELRSPAGALR